jgi:hypothetical protein
VSDLALASQIVLGLGVVLLVLSTSYQLWAARKRVEQLETRMTELEERLGRAADGLDRWLEQHQSK